MDEKWVTIVYGDGASARIPESALAKAREAAEYLRNAAKKPGSGYPPEEADRIFSLRIVKDDA